MDPKGEPSLLRLRAHLGDQAARRALGLPDVAPPEPVYEWAYGLLAWGQEAAVRAALAAVELCEGARRGSSEDPVREPDVVAALEAVRAWLAAPGEQARLVALLEEAWLDGREGWCTRTTLVAATSAMRAAAAPADPPPGFAAPAARAVVTALRVAPEPAVREAVRAALLAWLDS